MNTIHNKISSFAPARICLFGDHQDYLGLPVITAAIDRKIELSAEENQEEFFEIITPDIGETRKLFLNEDFAQFDSNDHYKSSLFLLQKYGLAINKGFKITVSGDIPINAGLSSSSAIVVAWVQFLLYAFGSENYYPSEVIAQRAYQAEVEVHGAPGGKMDQYAIGVGNVLFIDTSQSFSINRINCNLPCLIIGESGIPKNTIGLLKKTKEGALEAIKQVKDQHPQFDIKKLKEKDIPDYSSSLQPQSKKYFEAAIINHNVTLSAYDELRTKNPDPKTLGYLMNKHHNVLKDLLGITVPRIDAMIEAAISAGAFGAKIVGSGGGGCIVALASESNRNKVIEAILNAGAKDAYQVQVAQGAYVENIKN
jgi:galactokinase